VRKKRRFYPWPEFNAWYFKLKQKSEQAFDLLMAQIKKHTVKRRLWPTAICPSCGEAYPLRDGSPCLACQGQSPYINENP
jgi:formylmethanofuran dehydrogenase subunit E